METMHIAGAWKLPLISGLRKQRLGDGDALVEGAQDSASLISYAEPFGFATRNVDGNDALDCLSFGALGAVDGIERPAGVSRLHHLSSRTL